MTQKVLRTIAKYTAGGFAAGFLFISFMFGLEHLLPYDATSPYTYNKFAESAACTGQWEVYGEEGEVYLALACTTQEEIQRAVDLAIQHRARGMVEYPLFWIATIGFAAVGGVIGWRTEVPAPINTERTHH